MREREKERIRERGWGGAKDRSRDANGTRKQLASYSNHWEGNRRRRRRFPLIECNVQAKSSAEEAAEEEAEEEVAAEEALLLPSE